MPESYALDDPNLNTTLKDPPADLQLTKDNIAVTCEGEVRGSRAPTSFTFPTIVSQAGFVAPELGRIEKRRNFISLVARDVIRIMNVTKALYFFRKAARVAGYSQSTLATVNTYL